MDKSITYFDYNFKLADGKYLGEKLARSHNHAEQMRLNYEQRYQCRVEKIFYKKVIMKGGKCIYGF